MLPEVGEGQARFWDIWIKIIAGLIAIGTLIVGFNTLNRQGDQLQIQQQQQLKAQQQQFEATRKEQVKAMEEEYHRRFWDKKFDVYMRLCQAASSLTLAQSESDEYKQANHALMLIYGGEFQVVASPEVKKAFGEFLSVVSLNEAKPPPIKRGLVAWAPDLHRSLAGLALVCRQDSGSEFHLSDEQVHQSNEANQTLDDIVTRYWQQLESHSTDR
jgi:hypothetical protein